MSVCAVGASVATAIAVTFANANTTIVATGIFLPLIPSTNRIGRASQRSPNVISSARRSGARVAPKWRFKLWPAICIAMLMVSPASAYPTFSKTARFGPFASFALPLLGGIAVLGLLMPMGIVASHGGGSVDTPKKKRNNRKKKRRNNKAGSTSNTTATTCSSTEEECTNSKYCSSPSCLHLHQRLTSPLHKLISYFPCRI